MGRCKLTEGVRRHPLKIRRLAISALPLLLALATALIPAPLTSGRSARRDEQPGAAAGDPWTAKQLVEPAELAGQLKGAAGSQPRVVCVGFEFLYDAAHVPGAVLLGPGREASGLKSLEEAARSWPRDRQIVIYCGCCPMKQCPNLRPAFHALESMGFTQVRVLDVEHDFRTDWLQKGLPIEKAQPK